MSEAPPQRRPWQIHLSTVLVTSLLAGWFMLLNFGEPTVARQNRSGETSSEFLVSFPAWPIRNDWHCNATSETQCLDRLRDRRWDKVSVNAVIGLLSLIGAAATMEYAIRCKAEVIRRSRGNDENRTVPAGEPHAES
jgi:hypothetical protein